MSEINAYTIPSFYIEYNSINKGVLKYSNPLRHHPYSFVQLY